MSENTKKKEKIRTSITDPNLRKEIGERIRTIRKLNNLTQKEFGKKLGLTNLQIKDIEKGYKKIYETVLRLICYEFNVNYEWLVYGEGEMYSLQQEKIQISNKKQNIDKNKLKYIPIVEFKKLKNFNFAIIPLVEAKLSAGGGSFVKAENIIDHFAVKTDYLKQLGIIPEKAVFMKVVGDSMIPLINENDTVLVDLNDKHIYDGKIYAIGFEDSIFIKIIKIQFPDKIILKSKNPEYPDISIDKAEMDKLNLIGRIKLVIKEI